MYTRGNWNMAALLQSLHDRRIRTEMFLIVVLLLTLIAHLLLKSTPIDLWIMLLGTVAGVTPVFINAFRSLREREWASMDTLASVALIFSIIEGEWASAVFIALMLSAARLLEHITEARMERSIKSLMKLKPTTAKVERDGKLIVIATAHIIVGDIVVVDAGERIAVDGIIESGDATIDESSLTGESLPVDKTNGASVSSSTLVASGSVRVRTTRIGKDTTIERIIALVESSQEEKPEIETLGAKFGKIYLVFIFVGAAILLILTQNASLVLAVVLVVCADDVVIAIPLAHLRAIGTAAKRGIIVKGGKHLEMLGKVDTIVFDKTGTLTKGKPEVTTVVIAPRVKEGVLLQIAALAAQHSTHPLSKALVTYATKQGVILEEVHDAVVVGGKGVIAKFKRSRIIVGNEKFFINEGFTIDAALLQKAIAETETGKSISYVGKGNKVLGFCALSDTVKMDAGRVMNELRALGMKKIIMLSGDNERAAGALAKQVGIDIWFANLLPEDKVAKIKELSETGIVAMVGDGVNDAAALALAHVGIAMGGLGSDGAIESANIVLMHDNLDAIPQTIKLAHAVRRISIQDFFIWGISNMFGLALVFTGNIGPAGAAAYNFISDFFPLANSWRARISR